LMGSEKVTSSLKRGVCAVGVESSCIVSMRGAMESKTTCTDSKQPAGQAMVASMPKSDQPLAVALPAVHTIGYQARSDCLTDFCPAPWLHAGDAHTSLCGQRSELLCDPSQVPGTYCALYCFEPNASRAAC
jgi:hypothetical protein